MKKTLIGLASMMILATSVKAQEDTSTTKTTVITTTTTTSSATNTTNRDDNDRSYAADWPVFYLGAQFMPTFTSLGYAKVDNGVAEVKTTLGYGYGGLIGFNLSNHAAIQIEGIYSRLAQDYKVNDVQSTIRLDYINFPLLFRYNTGINKPVNFNIVVGPQIGLNTGSAINADDNGATTTVQGKLAVKKGDVGFAYGAGFDFNLVGFTKLTLGYRGVYGLIDISDNSQSITTSEYYVLDRSHVKTNAAYIGLTFGF